VKEIRNANKYVARNPEEKISLQTPWHSLESAMKIDPKEMEYAYMKYITFGTNRSHVRLGGWPYVNFD
jgi:hypothetical protein